MAAVFFTLILLTGNTMAQAVRERIPELAILKTIGFTSGSVLGLLLAESDRCCWCLGGVIGRAARRQWWPMDCSCRWASRCRRSFPSVGGLAALAGVDAVDRRHRGRDAGLSRAAAAGRRRDWRGARHRHEHARQSLDSPARLARYLGHRDCWPWWCSALLPGWALPVLLLPLRCWLLATRTGRQAWSATQVGIATIPQRLGSSSVVVVGIAGVVGVLVALLAMAAGFAATLKQGGTEDTAIVLRAGAQTELNSVISHETVDAGLAAAAGAARQRPANRSPRASWWWSRRCPSAAPDSTPTSRCAASASEPGNCGPGCASSMGAASRPGCAN